MTASNEVQNPDEKEEDVFDGNSFFGQLNWSDILFPHLMPYLTIEDCFRSIQLIFNLFTSYANSKLYNLQEMNSALIDKIFFV